MGWFERTQPKASDPVPDQVAKAVTSLVGAPVIAIFDLLDALEGGSSSPSGSQGCQSDGGCHCDCDSHR
jgi:hypothetical protein